MMIKKFISILLILVFSIPLLPAVQVGALLHPDQVTEEVPNAGADAPVKCSPLNEEIHKCFQHSLSLSFEQNHSIRSAHYILLSEMIPAFHSADIFAPPPNC
jgi:hypothetical protein